MTWADTTADLPMHRVFGEYGDTACQEIFRMFAEFSGIRLISISELALMWVYAWGVPNEKEKAMTNYETKMINDDLDASELLDTLNITKVQRRTSAGGVWVRGTIGEHRFEALAFPEHAGQPHHELDDSRISKLWVQRISDRATVANFDRGWDVRPTTPIAGQIVDLLAAGLAETVYTE